LTENPLNFHSEKVIRVILGFLEQKLYAFKDKVEGKKLFGKSFPKFSLVSSSKKLNS